LEGDGVAFLVDAEGELVGRFGDELARSDKLEQELVEFDTRANWLV
jgi:hypothetical protein